MSSADQRRARMQVRVYPSIQAHLRDDAAYWAALPAAERVIQVWRLSEEQWRLRGEFRDEGYAGDANALLQPVELSIAGKA